MRLVIPAIATLLFVPCTLPAATLAAGAEQTPLKIVAFGTSLTAGGRWTQDLQATLAQCLRRPVSVGTVAISGATSDWGMSAINQVISPAPDIVLVEFTANDAAVHRVISLSRSRRNLERMVDALRARLPGVRILVMAMNPIHGLRGLMRPFLDIYVEAHREVMHAKGLEFVDHRPAWWGFSEEQRAAAIPDGAHPLPEAAAAVIVPALVARIVGGPCQRPGESAGARMRERFP